jgi:hypothetical protein
MAGAEGRGDICGNKVKVREKRANGLRRQRV